MIVIGLVDYVKLCGIASSPETFWYGCKKGAKRFKELAD
jgi:hypothetical protein